MVVDSKTKGGKVLVFKGPLQAQDKTIQIEIPKEEEDRNALDLLRHLKGVKKALVFSTHLDDAVLSTGSLIAHLITHNFDVSILSAFTEGSNLDAPLPKKLIRQSGFSNTKEYFQTRKTEDREAISLLGKIQIHHFGLTDAAWRYTNSGEPIYPLTTLGVERSIYDTTFLELTRRLEEFKQSTSNTVVFGPIGWGRHVDHVLVRDAVAHVFPDAIFYADFPYTQKSHGEDEFVKKHQRSPIVWKANNYSLKAKAVAVYKTQIVSMFGENGYMRLDHETFYVKRRVTKDKS